MRPGGAAIERTPDAAAYALRRDRGKDTLRLHRIEHDRVAPIVLRRDERLARPRLARVARRVHAAESAFLRADLPEPNPADPNMTRIVRIDRNHADAARDCRLRARGKQPPALPAICRAIQSDPGVTIGREVRFAGAAIDDLRVRRMNRERAHVEHGLRMPEPFPRSPSIRALPDTAASRARPDAVGVRRITNQTRDAPANVRRPDTFPLRRARRRRKFLFDPRAFRHEPSYSRLSQRPRGPRLEPDAAPLMIPRNPPEFPAERSLPRSWTQRRLRIPRRFLPPRFCRCILSALSHGGHLQSRRDVLQHVPLVHQGGEVGRAEARPTDVRTSAPCLTPN